LTLEPKLLWSRPVCAFTRPLVSTADMELGNVDFDALETMAKVVDPSNLPDQAILIPGFNPPVREFAPSDDNDPSEVDAFNPSPAACPDGK
jgi:hypothetical protein